MKTELRKRVLQAVMGLFAASICVAQTDGLGGLLDTNVLGDIGVPVIESGTYTDEDTGFSIMVPDGFSGLGLPLPEVSIWVADGRQEEYAGDSAIGVQFLVASFPSESHRRYPGFDSDEPAGIEAHLNGLVSSSPIPGGEFTVSEVTHTLVSGRSGLRIEFGFRPASGSGAMHGTIYTVRHNGRSFVIPYLAGEGQEQRLRAFAEENIRTFRL